MNSVYDDIALAAQQNGVPIEVALAVADLETGGTFNPQAAGDRGTFSGGRFIPSPTGPPTSFGEYQLHQGGELGSLSVGAAEDPYTNASVALKVIANAKKSHPGATWGQVVAAGQRPADPAGYAAVVDKRLASFHASGMTPRQYFASISGGAHSWLMRSPGGGAPDTAGTVTTGGTAPVGTNVAAAPKADDWLSALDGMLNPSTGGVNPFKDTASALQLLGVRGGVAIVGVVIMGTGLLLMFGREIFGGALLAVPGVGEGAGALGAARSEVSARHAATVARRTQRGAAAVTGRGSTP